MPFRFAFPRQPALLRTGLVLAGFLFLADGLASPHPAVAADMVDVRKAIAEQRLFDAFEDLLPLAKEGNAEAQYELAGFYHYGRVGAADFTKARMWYQRSANQGNVDAMIGLAVMNGFGQGGKIDRREAVKWLVIAGNQQIPADEAAKVAEKRDELAAELSPDEMNTVLAEARSFVPRQEH
jgi:TPR repeat protein